MELFSVRIKMENKNLWKKDTWYVCVGISVQFYFPFWNLCEKSFCQNLKKKVKLCVDMENDLTAGKSKRERKQNRVCIYIKW
jgi:hypothetical protein